jgi:hypothetical protein
MAKKSKKKKKKKETKQEKAQEDDQRESENEDSHMLDHLSSKDKLMFMKLINEEQDQKFHDQDKSLISKLEELKEMNERYEKLSIEHDFVTNALSSVVQLEKENFELKKRLDKISCNFNTLQVVHEQLKCSHESLVESHAMLEIAHEVVVTMVKSSQPHTHPLTSTPSKLNISCANECASQASQSLIEHDPMENLRLKEEVEKLKKYVIRLKGKEKAQPSQDNRENMVKKLEKGSNLASSNIQQTNHITSKAMSTKSKKHGKRLCYGCGAYGHMRDMCPNKSWANKCEVAEKKASSKLANQLKMDEPKASIKCNKVSHLSNTCKDFKKTRNKAQVATRRCYACNEVGHMIYECHNKQNKDCSNKGRICYNCRRKGHLSYDCPKGNMPKPNAYVFNDKLRRTTNGSSTSQARYSPHASTRATWVPKHIATNSIGPNKSWVPKCA